MQRVNEIPPVGLEQLGGAVHIALLWPRDLTVAAPACRDNRVLLTRGSAAPLTLPLRRPLPLLAKEACAVAAQYAPFSAPKSSRRQKLLGRVAAMAERIAISQAAELGAGRNDPDVASSRWKLSQAHARTRLPFIAPRLIADLRRRAVETVPAHVRGQTPVTSADTEWRNFMRTDCHKISRTRLPLRCWASTKSVMRCSSRG